MNKGTIMFSRIYTYLINSSNDALLGATCSLAAHHCNITQKTGDDEVATTFMVSALQYLRQELQGRRMDLYSLASILILVKIEVFESIMMLGIAILEVQFGVFCLH